MESYAEHKPHKPPKLSEDSCKLNSAGNIRKGGKTVTRRLPNDADELNIAHPIQTCQFWLLSLCMLVLASDLCHPPSKQMQAFTGMRQISQSCVCVCLV